MIKVPSPTRFVYVGLSLSLSQVACGTTSDGDESVSAASITSFDDSGSGESGDASTAGSSESSTTSDSNAESTTATSESTSTTGDGDGDGDIPVCQSPCNTLADCTQASPAFDDDNYSCDDGSCVYLGCNSDAECEAIGLVCRDSGAGFDTCVTTCTSANDCAQGAGAAYDADNYACVFGGCVYTGCNTDTECASTTPGTVCHSFPGVDNKACVPSCTTAADCDQGQPAFDADNYACAAGICEYTGCNSDAECSAVTPLVCR